MYFLAARRRFNIVVTVIIAVALLIAVTIYEASLYQEAFLTGWMLLLGMLLLALFNVRKRLTMLPLGSASAWLQLHIYVGWLVILLFAAHVGWRVPNGALEIALTVLFVLVAGSGIVGLAFARSLPPRLTRRGEEVIFERIPAFITQLREEAEEIVLKSARETQSSTIGNFYLEQLSTFFSGPQNHLRHLIASRKVRFELLNEIDHMHRYLSEQEKEYAQRLRELVNKKDELDFHYALNLVLKVWLLVHVPATYALLILAALHLVLVYAYGGGVG